jgi:NADP-dependent 3-hydroxy acid dehydrogenase YdfG
VEEAAMARLDGTTAVVTGASSGIGAATARALAAHGASVALLARRKDRIDALAAELGGGATAHPTDVSDEAGVRASLGAVVAVHGGIGILVNNAGVGGLARADEADWDDWRTMVEVNVLGVLAASRVALPHLTEAAQGPRGVADLITVSSVAGRKVVPRANVYAATKHAVGAFSEGVRKEMAEKHVRVGLVEPGLTRTEIVEDGSFAAGVDDDGYDLLEADDVADAIAYAVTRPPRVAVNEILVRPTEQTR